MSKEKYNMSFTTGGLFQSESARLAKMFLECNDWDRVKEATLTDNLLQTRTLNTSRRNLREIVSRLKCLSPEELHLVTDGYSQDLAYILWVAVCRRYRFVGEFAVEVLRERFISLKGDLNYEDYDHFFNKKAEWHPELDKISSTTRLKLRQVLFKILREAGLLDVNNMINATVLSPRFLNTISHGRQNDLLFFPIFETQLREM